MSQISGRVDKATLEGGTGADERDLWVENVLGLDVAGARSCGNGPIARGDEEGQEETAGEDGCDEDGEAGREVGQTETGGEGGLEEAGGEKSKPQEGEAEIARLPGPGETDELGHTIVDYLRTAREMFDMANDSVDEQITTLIEEIEQYTANQDKREQDDDLLEIAKELRTRPFVREVRQRFYNVVSGVNDLNTLQNQSGTLISAAKVFLDELNQDTRVTACERNPFEVQTRIFLIYQVVASMIMVVAQSAQGK